jgi:transposase
MSIVTLSLPDVTLKTEMRPKACPHCSGETFQRWGRVAKPVKDNHYRTIMVYRYRCCHCHGTFRQYSNGVDRADQTLRLRKLSAILWVLGMSLRIGPIIGYLIGRKMCLGPTTSVNRPSGV